MQLVKGKASWEAFKFKFALALDLGKRPFFTQCRPKPGSDVRIRESFILGHKQ